MFFDKIVDTVKHSVQAVVHAAVSKNTLEAIKKAGHSQENSYQSGPEIGQGLSQVEKRKPLTPTFGFTEDIHSLPPDLSDKKEDKPWYENAFDWTKNAVVDTGNFAANTVNSVVGAVGEGISEGAQWTEKAAENTVDFLQGAAKGAVDGVLDLGKSIGDFVGSVDWWKAAEGTGKLLGGAAVAAGSIVGATAACAGEGAVAVGSFGTLALPAGTACVAGATGAATLAMGGILMASSGMKDIVESGKDHPKVPREETPSTDKKSFEPVRGSPAKRNIETGEIWKKDRLHKDHYEVYKNLKEAEKGNRAREVWEDGRLKGKF